MRKSRFDFVWHSDKKIAFLLEKLRKYFTYFYDEYEEKFGEDVINNENIFSKIQKFSSVTQIIFCTCLKVHTMKKNNRMFSDF